MITEICQPKLDWAAECGLDYCVNANGINLKETIKETFGKRRADIIIDCAAGSEVYKSILEAARQCSEIIITGNYKDPVEFFVPVMQRQEISMIGHFMYVREDYKTAIELLASGKIHTEKAITKVFPFDDYVKAFEYADANSDSTLKLLIKM